MTGNRAFLQPLLLAALICGVNCTHRRPADSTANIIPRSPLEELAANGAVSLDGKFPVLGEDVQISGFAFNGDAGPALVRSLQLAICPTAPPWEDNEIGQWATFRGTLRTSYVADGVSELPFEVNPCVIEEGLQALPPSVVQRMASDSALTPATAKLGEDVQVTGVAFQMATTLSIVQTKADRYIVRCNVMPVWPQSVVGEIVSVRGALGYQPPRRASSLAEHDPSEVAGGGMLVIAGCPDENRNAGSVHDD